MASAGFFALFDDLAMLLNDVALLSKVAAQKTAGVLGDDLALNAQQVSGFAADRELPVVWSVFKGAMLNKLIIVPVALAISAFIPWGVMPLLMLGGAFLCFEGFEKLAHRFLFSAKEDHDHHDELVQALQNPNIDLVAFEKEKIKGAVRTDFILSAEIVAIALWSFENQPFLHQALSLTAVAIAMTVGVYGLVACIVKFDDLGLHLTGRSGASAMVKFQHRLGHLILKTAPYLMKILTVLGTAAMFLVGGGILVHGFPWLHHAVEAWGMRLGASVPTGGYLLSMVSTGLVNAAVGLLAGGLVLLGVLGVRRFRSS
jgi:uncharacterized protein